MLKITIKAADESTLNRILHNLQATPATVVDAGPSTGSGLERFDTDALLAEVRRRLSKDGYVVNVVADADQLELKPEPEKASMKRRGRPPRTEVPTAVSKTEASTAASKGEPASAPPLSPPSRSEVIDALEKYAGQNGMIRAREIIADVSGVKNAALKDVNSADYRRLMEALAC